MWWIDGLVLGGACCVFAISVRMMLRGLLDFLSAGAFGCGFCDDLEVSVGCATVVDGLC